MFSKSPPNSKVIKVPVDIFGDSSALCGLGSLECLVQRLIGQMAFRLFLVRTDEVGHQQPVQIDYVNDNWKKRVANIGKEAFSKNVLKLQNLTGNFQIISSIGHTKINFML